MSERKRGFDEGAESSQQGSAKKAATRAPGDPSVDTSLSLLQPGGVADDRSDTEQLQSQAAAGRTQEEEQTVAPQGRGRGVERRTQNLISLIDLRDTSSVNRQASGSDGAGRGRAPVLQSQGGETLAGEDARGITGPWSYPGNATGMGTPIPGVTALLPSRPLMEAAMRQVIRREVEQCMSQPAIRQRLADIGMQQCLGTTPRPGVPAALAQRLNPVANQRGEASRGIAFTRHDGSLSDLHGLARASAPGGQLMAATKLASGSQSQERQANFHATVPSTATTGIWRSWRPQQNQVDVRAAVPPPATTAASVSRQPQQRPAYVRVAVPCPDCHNIFPNLACRICANVAVELVIGPHRKHPHRFHGQLPSLSEMDLRRLVEVTMANQPGPPMGPNLPRPNPLPGSCPGCHQNPGSFHPGLLDRGVPLHVCLCSVCQYDAWVMCPVCSAVENAAKRRAHRGL